MIQQYIEQKISSKNRGVYFKKGKWIFHVLVLYAIWISELSNFSDEQSRRLLDQLLCAAVLSLPFLSFFYFYCLYLIPTLFKRNRIRRFWWLMCLCFLVFPALQELLIQYIIFLFPRLEVTLKSQTLLILYRDFLLTFIGSSSILYVMELAEGIRTAKETSGHNTALMQTEKKLLKTKIAPEFMLGSLDALIQLSEEKSPNTPEAIIQFADVLRSRLYRVNDGFSSLEEEAGSLKKLFSFHNTIAEKIICSIEIAGSLESGKLPSLTLVNIIEPLLNSYKNEPDWSIFLYLNTEDEEVQIAIELYSINDTREATAQCQKNLELLFEEDPIFATERIDNLTSIRICLPTQSSTALL